MKISVIISTINDEDNISRVIDHAKAFDEVIVLDQGSTDDTCAVAESKGVRVIRFSDISQDPKTYAMQHMLNTIHNAWVLVVDGDELIPSALVGHLRDFIKQPGDCSGLYIPRKNYILSKFHADSYPDYQLRFFRREGTKWLNFKDSLPKIPGAVRRIAATNRNLALVHISARFHNRLRELNRRSDARISEIRPHKVSVTELIFAPIGQFLKSYFIDGLYKMGRVGYIRARSESIYKHILLSKMVEQEGLKSFWENMDKELTAIEDSKKRK